MKPPAVAWHMVIAGALAVPLFADGALIPVLPPHYSYQSGNYGQAYDAVVNAGHIALGADGALYFLDGGLIRKVAPNGTVLPVAGCGASSSGPAGERTPALLDGNQSKGFALDTQGNLFIGGFNQYNVVNRIGSDGIEQFYAIPASGSWYTYALATDPSGNLYALEAPYEFYGSQVLRILTDGTAVPFAGTGTPGYSGDGGPAVSAEINALDIAADGSGNLFIADGWDYVIRKVDPQGTIATVAQGTAPITVDTGGNLYYFLTDGTLNRLRPSGEIAPVATIPLPGGVAVDSSGNIFVSSAGRLYSLSGSGTMQLLAGCACFGDGVPVTWAVALNPAGVVQDQAGNIYVSDSGNNTVRRIAPDGTLTLIAGTGGAGLGGDGGLARMATLSAPSGLALDNAGDLFIADRGNSVIRKVGVDGYIQTIAGNGTAGFSGDGGPATAARMALPDGVAVDAAGNIYIADTVNHRIREVTADGVIRTIAGSDSYGTSGDGGPASQALLINPRELAFDLNRNLLFTDSSAHMVRKITPEGIVQRVSGTGIPGHTGDGGPAISAEDWTPWGLAVDAAGDIMIGDTGSSTIRIVNPSGTIQTLVSYYGATGLAADPSGNLWIAGGGLSLFSQGSSPVPLAPVIANNGVANAQSGQVAAIAPGEMVTISGNYLGPATAVPASAAGGVLSTELAGVQVFFDDAAAPLLLVSAQQIQAVVPFAVSGKSTVGIKVEYGGMTSNTASIGVLPAEPGVFNQYGQALALNTPGGPGSIVSLFVTGSGVMLPPEEDGAIGASQASFPALPVSALLGVFPFPLDAPVPWIPLEVTYAGSASWLISGTIQVNLRLPDPLPQTDYPVYPIAVRVGDSLAPFVQVAVKAQ